MIVIELLEAILKLGMPVFATSWWVIHRRYKRGDITREADRRTVKTDLKAYRKKWRSDDKSSYGLMENKWMRFGEWFDNGLIGFVVDIFVNQLENFVSAITWFAYWADEDRSVFIWVGIPYAAYLLGISHASGLNVDVSENLESGEEPETRIEEKDDLYSLVGLEAAYHALRKTGVLAVWSATPAPRFTALLKRAGFKVEEHRVRAHQGKGSRHVIWVASRD